MFGSYLLFTGKAQAIKLSRANSAQQLPCMAGQLDVYWHDRSALNLPPRVVSQLGRLPLPFGLNGLASLQRLP